MEYRTDIYTKRILDYLCDGRYTQAVLIDGPWGCGKTYYVKKELISALLNRHLAVFQISLYGMEEISDIQAAMYAQAIEYRVTGFVKPDDINPGKKDTEDKCYTENEKESKDEETLKEKLKKLVKSRLSKMISLFGESILKTIENKTDIDTKFVEKLLEEYAFSTGNNTVLIFDDVERCHIDTLKLMGFLNNLTENNGFKVILIANEKEIAERNSELNKTLQYLVASNVSMLETGIESNYSRNLPNTGYQNTNNKDKAEKWNVHDHIKHIAENHKELFPEIPMYTRTKEKLIGMKVSFVADIDTLYDDLVDKYVGENVESGDLQRSFFKSNRDCIIGRFSKKHNNNLRTLINVLVCSDRLINAINNKIETAVGGLTELFSTASDRVGEYIDAEKKVILTYVAEEYIRVTSEEKLRAWSVNRSGRIPMDGLIIADDTEVLYGYAFVDDYIRLHEMRPDVIWEDFSKRISDSISQEQSQIDYIERTERALHALEEWYYLEDEEIDEALKKLKEEIREGKYYPYEYKDIVHILMCIDNIEFGMHPQRVTTSNNGPIYDSAARDFPENMTIKPSTAGLSETESEFKTELKVTVRISEYVEEMVNDLKTRKKEICRDELGINSHNYEYAREIRQHMMPLIKFVEEQEQSHRQRDENIKDQLFSKWDDTLVDYCRQKKFSFLDNHCFLTLTQAKTIMSVLIDSKANDIRYLREAIENVYYFGNMGDFFSGDKEAINMIMKELKEDAKNEYKKYNKNHSRTKLIGLIGLEYDFEKYLTSMGDRSEQII